MQNNWVNTFYKNQFEWTKDALSESLGTFYEQEAETILEQVGRSFQTVLELGAGRGEVANAVARRGKDVTTIELVHEIARYAKEHAHSNVTVVCADFYKVALEEKFDVILYLDGFGVGSDVDQLVLLQRIYDWLDVDGYALMDIYQPLYWEKVAGVEMSLTKDGELKRKYGYDAENQRMMDTWWTADAAGKATSQSLACYTPKQIYDLCQQANLEIVGYFPGGAMDFENQTFREVVALDECLSYRIKVQKK